MTRGDCVDRMEFTRRDYEKSFVETEEHRRANRPETAEEKRYQKGMEM